MQQDAKKERIMEWSVRILLTVHFLRCLSGYIDYWQAKYQLTSPLIPAQTIEQISEPYWKGSLVIGCSFLVALWLYFFRMRIAAIVVSAVSIAVYGYLVFLFAQ